MNFCNILEFRLVFPSNVSVKFHHNAIDLQTPRTVALTFTENVTRNYTVVVNGSVQREIMLNTSRSQKRMYTDSIKIQRWSTAIKPVPVTISFTPSEYMYLDYIGLLSKGRVQAKVEKIKLLK